MNLSQGCLLPVEHNKVDVCWFPILGCADTYSNGAMISNSQNISV